MTIRHDLDIVELTCPGNAGPAVRQELTACWVAVTNAGGAAGFPFSPVNASDVAPGLARINGALAGWVVLSRDPSPLVAHWGTSTTCRPGPHTATRASDQL